MGDSVIKWASISLTLASVTVMSIGPASRRVMLMSFNDVGHLPVKMRMFL